MSLKEEEDGTSGSECSSDEELEKSLQIALQSMKKSLSISTRPEKQQTESRTHEFIKQTHQQIYDSFDSDDNEEDKTNVTQSQNDVDHQTLNAFMIDKSGSESSDKNAVETEVYIVDMAALDEEVVEENKKPEKLSKSHLKKKGELSSSLQVDLDIDDLYVDLFPLKSFNKNSNKSKKSKEKREKIEEPEIMKQSVLTEDYERQVTIPTEKSKRVQKRERRIEKAKTKGSKWFEMPAPELTEEKKNDFLVYQMRRSLDPKRFYKTNDAAGIPKYYQFGTVVEHAADFYDSRVPKKQRKANMVEELLADSKFRKYNKRKYTEIQEAKRLGTGPYNAMKKLKRKKAK